METSWELGEPLRPARLFSNPPRDEVPAGNSTDDLCERLPEDIRSDEVKDDRSSLNLDTGTCSDDEANGRVVVCC
jgi:hypothetical protein